MNDVVLVRVFRADNLLETKAVSKELIQIGRDPASDIRIDNTSVSRTHAHIACEEDGSFLEDAGSQNGTMLNGESLTERTKLATGDVVRIGKFDLHIEVHEGSTWSKRQAQQELDRQIAEPTIVLPKPE